jgi:hypothetical protein
MMIYEVVRVMPAPGEIEFPSWLRRFASASLRWLTLCRITSRCNSRRLLVSSCHPSCPRCAFIVVPLDHSCVDVLR